MADALNLFPANIQFVDPKTGLLTPPALRALRNVYRRIGGATGQTITELSLSDDEDSGLEEIRHEFAKEINGLLSQPPADSAQHEIGKAIDALLCTPPVPDTWLASQVQFRADGAGVKARTAQDKLRDVVSVKDFGAIGDGVADDTDALNAAFAWLRDYDVTDPPLSRPLRLTGHNGIYRCDGSVNASGINLGRTWELDGLNIWSHATGKTALDLTGLRWAHLSNVRVWGDQTDQPHTGILLARNASTCSDNLFENVSTDGYFTQAGLLVYAAEVNKFDHCHIWNRRVADGSGESWALIMQGTDYKTMVSDFQTLSTGRHSFTVNQFDQCMIQKPFGIAGPTMFIQDAASLEARGSYITNGSGSAIVWRLTSGFTPYRVYLDFQQETTGTDRFVQFTSDAAAAREIRGLECTFGNVYCDSEVFASDTLTGLTLNNFKCHLYRMATGVTLANKLFAAATATLTTIRGGDIVTPTSTDFNGVSAFASFQGKAVSLDGSYDSQGREGTWTPALTFSTPGDFAVTYALRAAVYHKIGRLVTVQFHIETSAFTHTTASGDLQITGLPFTNNATITYTGALTFRGLTLAGGHTQVQAQIAGGEAVIRLRASGSALAPITVGASNMPTGGTVVLRGTIQYHV